MWTGIQRVQALDHLDTMGLPKTAQPQNRPQGAPDREDQASPWENADGLQT